MTKPNCCAQCPAAKFSDTSTDDFDFGQEVRCGFTGLLIDGFYEHPGSELIDRKVSDSCPL